MVLPEELNEKADKVEKPEDVTAVITKYEYIIRTKKIYIHCVSSRKSF